MRGVGDPTEDDLSGAIPEYYRKNPKTETLARVFLQTTDLHKLVQVLSDSPKGMTRSLLASNKYEPETEESHCIWPMLNKLKRWPASLSRATLQLNIAIPHKGGPCNQFG